LRLEDKKKVINGFLKELEKDDIHLVEFKKFSNNSVWSKDNPQPSHRTMINVSFKVDRLNHNDIEQAIENFHHLDTLNKK